MSWSVEITGTREGVAKRFTEQMDRVSAQYPGKEEAADIVACKLRGLLLIGACDLGQDVYGNPWNAVHVKANGSHGCTGSGGLTNAGFSLFVERVVLAL